MTIPSVVAVAAAASVVAVTTVSAVPVVIATNTATSWFDFILQLVALLTPIALAYMAYKQHTQAKQTSELKTTATALQTEQSVMSKTTSELKEDVKVLTVHTNSIKDALVEATGRAASAEGNLQGRAEQKQETKDDAATAALSPTPVVVENEDAIKVQTVRQTPNRAAEPGDKGKA